MTTIAARLRQQAETLLAMAAEIESGQSQASDFANILDNAARSLCVKEAAARAKLSTRQMYRIAPIVGRRVAGQWRIDAEQLSRWRSMANDGEGRHSNRDKNK